MFGPPKKLAWRPLCLCDCDFRQLRVGSDGEASLRKAVDINMRGVCLVSCTRHLYENLRRNAQKVRIFKHFFACRVVNVWNSLPLSSEDFRSLHCFRSSLNNIDFSRFLINE